MKTLLLLRHAQPSQTSPNGRDFDRPLLDAGRAEASRVGHFLARRKLTPDAILSSPAIRARETAALVGEAAQLAAVAHFDERIYDASAEQLLEVIAETKDGATATTATTLLVVGHNPGLAELLIHLTGAVLNVPPATLAHIDLDIEKWSEALTAEGRLAFALPPPALADN